MYHQHNAEEHILILADAKAVFESVNQLYIHHHNGDVKLNKRLIDARDKSVALIKEIEMHANSTRNVDSEWEQGQMAIRELKSRDEKKEEFWSTTWGNIFKVASGVVGTVIAAYLITIITNK